MELTKNRLQHYYSVAQPWLIWGVASFFVLFQFIYQLSIGVMVTGLMRDFHMSAFGISILASSYYFIYVALQTPAGWFIDRFGPRRILTIGALVCTLGSLLFAIATQPWLALVGRILMGGGSAFAFVSTCAVIRIWFPRRYFIILMGAMDTIAMLATIACESYFAYIVQAVGWRHVMWVGAAIGLVTGLMCWFVIRDRKDTNEQPQHDVQFFQPLRVILSSQVVWLNSLYAGVLSSLVNIFAAVWIVPFVMQVYKIELHAAAWSASAIFLGIAVGCLLLGLVRKLVPNKRVVLMTSALLCFVLLDAILYTPPEHFNTMLMLLFALGVASATYLIPFETIKDHVAQSASNIAIGFANAVSVGMAPILQPIIGWLITASVTHRGVSSYSLIDMQIALTVLPFSMLIAVCLVWFMPKEESHDIIEVAVDTASVQEALSLDEQSANDRLAKELSA